MLTLDQQYSLTKSMNGLKTNGSRETSPWLDVSTLPHAHPGRESSPGGLFNSPSPNPPAIDFQPRNSAWSGGSLSANHVMIPQQLDSLGPVPFQVRPNMQTMSGIPAFDFQRHPNIGPGPYHLKISGRASKSRVETQIRVNIILSPLPPGVTRLHLPTHTISKPKLLAKPTPQRSRDMLELHTALVCSSAMQDTSLRDEALQRARTQAQSMKLEPLPEEDDDPNAGQNGAEVHICNGCMTRERKRAGRKKVKKPEDEELWMRDENRRIVVFNNAEVKEWAPLQESDGFSVDCNMRIACYCRHHGEKLGFQVIFTITDFQGGFVAQAMSSNIMITDDHKTHSGPSGGGFSNGVETTHMQPTPRMGHDNNALSPSGVPFRMSNSSSDLQALNSNVPIFPTTMAPTGSSQSTSMAPTPRILSRPASPTLHSGPSSKKRKASGSVKVPTGLSMTRLDTTHPTTSPPHQQASAPVTTTTSPSPFSPLLPSYQSATEPMFGQNPLCAGQISQPFATGPPTPNGSEQAMFRNGNRSASLENLAMATAHMYSAPTSAHPSRAPSPGSLRAANGSSMQQQPGQFAQALAGSLYNDLSMGINAVPSPPPSVIHKIIPAEGPKSGGIEVTILGSNFHRGLEVMFGDVKATTTTYWGETSLVCLLPPSAHSGTVLVSFTQPSSAVGSQFTSKQQPIFKYLEDDESQLMRTALTVLGLKMNGKVENISDIARRIIGDMNSPWAASSSGNSHGGGPQFNHYSFDPEVETQLLKVLELIDLDDSPHKPKLNLRRSTGQTMLHLACSLGQHRFVAGLLARGANPDVRDKGGYTPLHMAALNDHPEIVRRLITCGADPTIRTLSGLTASDVARSREVVRAIRRVEVHARSRSLGSAHSRASSLTSLKSLWEPLSATTQVAAERPGNGDSDESPEYSEEDVESEEDPDADDVAWLDMRRPSTVGTFPSRRGSLNPNLDPPQPAVVGGRVLNSAVTNIAAHVPHPAAAVTAFKDQFAAQFQQIQQAMALQLQNLPQFPYLPQMPTMSPLADYQASLNSAAVLQRLASMVPNISGSRPGSADNQPSSAKELDGRWWDMSSFMATPAPPPAYDEIYPQGDLDKKQASAAQAAAEAEADHKCATLYDQPSAPVQVTESSRTQQRPQQLRKLPTLLQIGRKNAITKEQQENLRRARAEKMKRLGRDRNLFFIWVSRLQARDCLSET